VTSPADQWGPRPLSGDLAALVGTVEEPVIEVRFEYHDLHATTGEKLIDWVRSLPDRNWNRERRCWSIRGTGPDPAGLLGDAGFDPYFIDLDDPFVDSVDDVVAPLVTVCDKEGYVAVWPRLLGFEAGREMLGPTAHWVAGARHWELPMEALPRPGLELGIGVALAVASRTLLPDEVLASAAVTAASIDMEAAGEHGQRVLEAVGDIPDWFGLELDGYQVAGAIAAVAGHRLFADEPGLGKTRQALAAAAIIGARRILVLTPPSTVTNWCREATASGVADWTLLEAPEPTGQGDAPPTKPGADGSGAPTSVAHRVAVPDASIPISPRVVPFRSGRKEPKLPDAGVVVVPDSLLSRRPATAQALREWKADVVIVDEAHRTKGYWSSRAKALRAIAQSARRLPIAITGTALFADAMDLAGPLEIAGHLGPTFGGFDHFRETYARETKFGWTTRKRQLPQLKRELDERVWVRRNKMDVQSDLPRKRRQELVVDVDLVGYRAAYGEVIEVIDEFLDRFVNDNGSVPTLDEIQGWARSEVSLVARLRKATGLCKVQAAVDYIDSWVSYHAEPDDAEFDRPLLVWSYHREVSEALAAAVPALYPTAGVIIGGISSKERDRVVDGYQAGRIPVVVASMAAAGVGINLTRGCDQLIVEPDWTPGVITQAEDRQARRGQRRPVTVNTMIAPGTLDARIQAKLNSKLDVLKIVLSGNDHAVTVTDDQIEEVDTPSEMVCEIAVDRLQRRTKELAGAARRVAKAQGVEAA